MAKSMPNDWDYQEQELAQRRKYAEALRSQGMQPLEQTAVGGQIAPIHWTQGLAKMLQAYTGAKELESVKKERQDMAQRRQTVLADTFANYTKASQGSPAEMAPSMARMPNPDGSMQQVETRPAVAPNRGAALAELMKNPDTAPYALQAQMAQMTKADEPIVVGRTLKTRSGQTIGVDETWQAEQRAAREAKKADLETKLADQRTSREEAAALRRELAANASADRRMIAGMMDARREQKNVPKLPTSALKMQQEELDAIGTNSAINADLAAMGAQIESGELQLGPVKNLTAKAKNFLGASDESSKNLASFQATLEKLRNDSLRLNKGVQTEGDAVRAWNEMLANINDPKLVKQRLGEIQKINERAANLRRMNVDSIRSNFGVDPMDVGGYQNQPAAVGGGGAGGVDALLKKYGG